LSQILYDKTQDVGKTSLLLNHSCLTKITS
jgi:hypothetical protein